MELVERMDESAEDMTAAEIAPRPIKETHYIKIRRRVMTF
jgi:hypothetical protein